MGLVTIKSISKICSLRKNIWKYYGGSVFFREGSISLPKVFDIELKDSNSEAVATIEQHAKNNIELTLDGVIDFLNHRHKDLESDYKVFKEQFVVCWAGNKKVVNGETYFYRVDIELINEQVKLFYSNLDEVTITYNNDSFTTIEYVQLGLAAKQKYYPLEKVVINFSENGTYQITSDLLFDPPIHDEDELKKIYKSNNILMAKANKNIGLSIAEVRQLKYLADSYLICFLNGFEEAKEQMENSRQILKPKYPGINASLKEALRVLRKVKYS